MKTFTTEFFCRRKINIGRHLRRHCRMPPPIAMAGRSNQLNDCATCFYKHIRFLKFRPQDLFLGKFGPKKSNLSVLPENWHTWYIEDDNSYFNISFQNLQSKIHFWANLSQKTQSCPFCLKIGTHGISKMLILISTLVFWISNQISMFGQMWAKKLKVFAWKLAQMVSRGCGFLLRY